MPAYSEAIVRLTGLIGGLDGIFRASSTEAPHEGAKMLDSKEQVVEVVEEEETEIVELSLADLQWIGGGADVILKY